MSNSMQHSRHRHRPYYGSRKRPRRFLGVSSHEKRKRACLPTEEEISRIDVPTTSTTLLPGEERPTSHSPVSSSSSGGSSISEASLSSYIQSEDVPDTSSEISREVETSTEVATSGTEISSEPLPSSRPTSRSSRKEISSPTETASSRKLSPMLRELSPTGEITIPPSERECETLGVRLVNLDALSDLASIFARCIQCHSSMKLHEECGGRRHGVATYLALRCVRCSYEYCITDPNSSSSRALNARIVLGSRLCGLGRSGADCNVQHNGFTPSICQACF